ncbi:two-component system sensor histidine kinase YesM [Paenibacillus endophyticus]|uniref:Two-component system sensor histidine kinase YesM n=1 Tax=Paenibacillus endophyticus TaxID=1294268 RepID=A0A7W5G8P3_9BACL|nr:histidine kinase [Paenibacillus endophyticus]MBB3150132.1 two-component system sensor histidine kinase YesM [Paenibacillus endophyticus]
MRLRENTFAKMITLIILLLIPIIVLYTLSIQTSIGVINDEMKSLKQKDITFLASEIDKSVTTLSTLGFLLSEDIHIQQLQNLHLIESAYQRNDEKLRILERLRLLNVAQRWDTQYSITAPASKQLVSTNTYLSYDLDSIKKIFTPNWKYKEMTIQSIKQNRFVRHIVKPKRLEGNLDKAGIIVEISFPEEHLIKDLDTFKLAGKGDPFLLHADGSMIKNRTADKEMTASIQALMQQATVSEASNQIITIRGNDFLVTSAHVKTLDWYLIDYVPLADVLKPIVKSRNLFYGSVGLLLIMSLLAGYLLYRNVQRPIGLLIRSVKRLQEGNYATRITANPKNEFTYLFQRFNDMAANTEQLIQKVYVEELRRREANVKQLQSQINPHFLYNCFALIRSLARLGKKESVMKLAMHLSTYYRYTTRVEKLTATLKEELQLVESYLEIQQFHIQHLSYHIQVPETMLSAELPRLLLQPIVENAVLHGIERFDGDGLITITGESDDRYHTIIVADNGIGMTEELLRKLEKKIMNPPDDSSGCALWNIRQRMLFQFGQEASITFRIRDEGGVAVHLSWPHENYSN